MVATSQETSAFKSNFVAFLDKKLVLMLRYSVDDDLMNLVITINVKIMAE